MKLKPLNQESYQQFQQLKKEVENKFEVISLARSAKGCVVKSKSNYSKQEKEWFKKFLNRHEDGER